MEEFYNWTRDAFAPAFLVGPDYKGNPPAGNERFYLKDRANVLLGFGYLRQVRIQKSEA